ncbi:pitrilysin family protein [Phenylobacterium sp.]|uniref:M16 family metallopeptidase n=1 Tax=Phenylobacterium sp. TaxID=1871053 RepID=UPI002737013F|nr:M16 family metallopeptidase [Phenylobacterium sp.]MDP3853996.1 insulinase family protein [Phenylobacterium sp.]
MTALVLVLAAPSYAASFPLPKFGFGRDRPAAAAARPKPGEWAQARSDIAADPEIVFGALPNGMRYAVRKQQIPPGQAALRLRFDVGSLMESDKQQGLAHFLEHMAFNGSKAVPEGEMIKILERLGLAFGADTNASTDFDETTYKLDLPRTDDETVDTSLMLLREAAGNLSLDAAAIDRERGVVLSEERARDTPPYRVYKSRLEFLLKDQRPPTRYPIGKVEVLQTAPAAEFTDFYNRYYRPERAVLVAVGDFDVAAMEAKIKARFGDWTPVGPAGADPDLGALKSRKTEAKLVVEPGVPLSMQMAWLRPDDTEIDTTAKRQRDLVEQLGFSVLNRRLQRLARGATPPFLGAGAFESDEYDAAEVTMVVVNAEPTRWREALTAVEQEQRRAVQHGVRQDELDREIDEYRASLKADAAGAATRTPAGLAGEIVGSLSDDEVVSSPAQDLALFEAAVKDLKADQVSAALKAAFKGDGPLLFMASPKAVAGGDGSLVAALQISRKMAVAQPTAPTQVAWPYENFGTPGVVAETREAADLDTAFLRFENGVRLTVKPTRFKDDEVLVRVNVGRGRIDLPKDRQNVAWASGAYIEGGLKQISAEDMEQVLASRVYGAEFGIGDDAFVLSGATRTDDLGVQLQVLTSYVSEPGWREQAFQRLKNSGKTIHDQYEATVSGVVSRDLAGLLHGGDERWVFPSRDEMADAKLESFKADVAPALAAGQIEVVIVGDTTVEKAIEAVARTFGALPPRPAAAPPPRAEIEVGFPSGVAQPVIRTHKGRGDQAVGYIAWRTNDFFANPQRARDTAVLGEVLELRLIEELREAQGATYSPNAAYSHSFVWPGWGYVSASVEVPPDKLPAFFADVKKIATDLRTKEISPDELARAKKPRLEQIEKARETNGYWLQELSGAQADPRRLDATRAMIPGTERVTAADVKRAAEAVLKDETMWMFEVKPAGA